MKILLDGSRKKIEEASEKFDFKMWQLNTPISRRAYAGVPWALDNGCYAKFESKIWMRQLRDAKAMDEKPIFVCLPDVVGCARRTLELFDLFKYKVGDLKRALVLQNGIGDLPIPWDTLDAVFVGGDDSFKTSRECEDAVKTAKILGKWIHIGRVNSPDRAKYWLGVADSIDGSGISKYDHMMKAVVDTIKGTSPQVQMF